MDDPYGYREYNSEYFKLIDFDMPGYPAIYQEIKLCRQPGVELPRCKEIRAFQIDPAKISRATIDHKTEIIGDGEDLMFLHATNVEYFLSRKEVMKEITDVYHDVYSETCDGKRLEHEAFHEAIMKVSYYTPETILYRIQKLLDLPCSWVAGEEVLTALRGIGQTSIKLDMSKVDNEFNF